MRTNQRHSLTTAADVNPAGLPLPTHRQQPRIRGFSEWRNTECRPTVYEPFERFTLVAQHLTVWLAQHLEIRDRVDEQTFG